jgi:hypothetical protein
MYNVYGGILPLHITIQVLFRMCRIQADHGLGGGVYYVGKNLYISWTFPMGTLITYIDVLIFREGYSTIEQGLLNDTGSDLY